MIAHKYFEFNKELKLEEFNNKARLLQGLDNTHLR